MVYSGKLLGVMVATALWMPAAGMLYSENILAQEASSSDTEAAVRLAEADRLLQQGQVSQFPEALQFWQQALELYRDPAVQAAFPQESHQGEGRTLTNIGYAYFRLVQYDQALSYYQQSLLIFQAIGVREASPEESRRMEGDTLINIGKVYSRLEQYEQAISYYQQSLHIFQEIEDRGTEGSTLITIGALYRDLGQYEQAISYYQQSLPIFQAIGDRRSEGDTLIIIGNVYSKLGQYEQVLSYYQQSLSIRQAIGDRQTEGSTLNAIGGVYVSLGQYEQALSYYQQSLSIFQAIGSSRGEGDTLNAIGMVYHSLGQYEQALSYHQRSLPLFQVVGYRWGEGDALTNIGSVYFSLGRYDQALSYSQQSLSVFQSLGDRQGEGGTLNNIGNVYVSLGRYEQALSYLQQSLSISQAISDRNGEGGTLNNIGSAYISLEQYEQALSYFQQSLSISQAIGDRNGEGETLANIGLVYLNLGQHEQALSYYEQSLPILQSLGDRRGEGTALGNLGLAYADLGQYQEAIALYEKSLAITRKIGDRQVQGNTLNNLGAAYYDLRQFSASTETFLEAIAIFDTLRTTDLPDAEKVAFFDTYLGTYLSLQRSLVAQNEPEQALVYGERGRARAFVELLATRIKNNGNADVTRLESINSLDLSQIQRVAREQNATLVNYSVIFDESLFIWVIQPTGEIAFQQVDLGDRNLSELVSLVRETLGARSQDRATIIAELTPEEAERRQAQRQQQLQQLHQLLIEPIALSLPTDPNQRVIFIPHQDLFLVPFAALVDGNGDYLIENHTILTAPSIQVLDLTYRQAIANNARSDRPTNSLIVGNPIMPSIWNPQTNQTEQLSNLPGAEREAIAIAKALNTDALLSGSASKATVMARMPNARIIHLATHGLLEYGTPEDSGVLDVPGAIALAPAVNESGLLTAAEILQMDLNAELVVLSACDTGRGRITGDGVIGLSRAFVTAGVPSLMVSLWAVDDDATAEWMVTFYNQWQQTGDKAQAVRQAMLTTMENHPDPRLWAAFALIGSAE